MKKRILLASSVGIAAGVLCALELRRRKQKRTAIWGEATAELAGQATQGASMASIEDGEAVIGSAAVHALDDQGTDQSEASQIVRDIRDKAFDANNEKLALALGRSTEEIEQWTSGSGFIDGDALMKARSLALLRGLEVE